MNYTSFLKKTKKFALIGAVISSAFLLAACNKYGSSSSNTTTSNQQATQSGQAQDVVTITISDTDFSPTQSTVKSGGKITWVNNSKNKGSVASDPHPTHTANPELTNGQFVTELAPGASATVTVTKTGTWGFHDHLNPSTRGKVTVQ